MPPMRVEAIGYGAGDKDFAGQPNVLRVLVGDGRRAARSRRIVTMECEIDDMNPQLFGPLMDRLYAAGALDVYYAAVQMKKNRPGTLVTVIARPERRRGASPACCSRETTTIGVRYQEMLRECLEREMQTRRDAVSARSASRSRARDGRTAQRSARVRGLRAGCRASTGCRSKRCRRGDSKRLDSELGSRTALMAGSISRRRLTTSTPNPTSATPTRDGRRRRSPATGGCWMRRSS